MGYPERRVELGHGPVEQGLPVAVLTFRQIPGLGSAVAQQIGDGEIKQGVDDRRLGPRRWGLAAHAATLALGTNAVRSR